MLLLIAAAATLPGYSSAIRPLAMSWTTDDDYPSQAIERGEQGYVGIRVEIAPDGKPSGCDVTSSSGSQALDKAACVMALKRRYHPIKDFDGKPVVGVFRGEVAWLYSPPANLPRRSNIDLDLNVKALPANVASPAVVSAQIIVDSKGAIETCVPDQGDALPILGRVACQQASALWSPQPAHGESGAAVRSIQVVKVQFTVGAASAN